MSERDELIDQLRYRPVATTAAQMRKAADLLERDGAELERLRAENAALRSSIEGLRDRKTVLEQHFDAAVADMVTHRHSDLRAEIERLKAGGCARDQRTTQYCAEAKAALARADAAEKDAARYRWLRTDAYRLGVMWPYRDASELDAAIDAAIVWQANG